MWRRNRFVPDWVLVGLAVEASLTIDVNIEFKSDAVIKASKNYAVRYRSSLDFSALDHLESFENCVKYIHWCTLTGGRGGTPGF